jgi:hypothetical protein
MQPNRKLIEAILVLEAIEEAGLYGGTYSDRQSVERCQRILDALVPPPPKAEESQNDGGES